MIFTILLLITVIIFYVSGTKSNISELVVGYNILVFIALGCYLFVTLDKFRLEKQSYFQLEIIFWIFYFIVFYLPYVHVFDDGHIQESTFVPRQFVEQGNRAVTASTIGFIAFMMGRYLPIHLKDKKIAIGKDLLLSKFLQIISILASLFFGIAFIPQALIMIASSYAGSEFSDLNDTINYFFLQFFLSVLSINALYQVIRLRKISLLFVCSCIIYIIFVLMILLTGDRSGFIKLIAIPLFVISHYLLKVKLRYIVLGGILIFILYDFIETFRMMEEFTIEEYYSLHEERNEKHEGDSSFNNTTTLTRASFYYIDCLNSPHSYGYFLIISALRSIPFGITTFFPNEKYYGTAPILTDLCHSDFSLGSSIIAESYIEFGLLGVILYLFVIGFLVNYCTVRLLRNRYGLMELSLYAILFSIIIILPRYSTAIIVREIVWMYLLLLLAKFIYKNA